MGSPATSTITLTGLLSSPRGVLAGLIARGAMVRPKRASARGRHADGVVRFGRCTAGPDEQGDRGHTDNMVSHTELLVFLP